MPRMERQASTGARPASTTPMSGQLRKPHHRRQHPNRRHCRRRRAGIRTLPHQPAYLHRRRHLLHVVVPAQVQRDWLRLKRTPQIQRWQLRLRTRKFITNGLLNRKQMVVDVMHPGRANVSRTELQQVLAKNFSVNDEKTIFCFGFKTAFGGQKSTGFCLIYEPLEDAISSEPKYRLIRAGLKESVQSSRKQKREMKNPFSLASPSFSANGATKVLNAPTF